MTIASNKNTPRNTYTATAGQTAFTIGFEFFKVADVKVYKNGTLLTYNASPSSASQYKITGTASASDDAYEFGAGGTVTLGAGATADDIIVIIRDITLERTSDFPTTGAFDITSLNTQLDTMTSMLSDIKQQSDRSVKLLDTDTISATVTLPAKASRQDKMLGFDSSGNVETTISSSGLSTLSTITSDITTVAGISSAVSNVSSISSAVSSVSSNSANINSVAAVSSLITSDFVSDLNTLATTDIVNDLNTLATADIVSDLNTLATTDIVSDLNTLATTDIVNDLNTLATADIVSDLNTLATTDIVSDLNQLATTDFVSDLNAIEGIKANVTTVANNVTGVNSFAERYRVGSSDPTSSLDEGDLFYNSTDNAVKFYNGTSWASITAGLSDIVGDVTPQLGGNLDVNGNSIVSVSNGNIAITPNGSGKVILDGLSFPTADGTSGQALTTDGSGNVSFNTIQASELSTAGNVFSNYNNISSDTTITTASTKNSVLFGVITVSSNAVLTIGGNGDLRIL